MKKRIGRRFVSLLLTVVTVLTMLPAMTLPALAATKDTLSDLDDKTIGLSFDGDADNAWTAGGNQIEGHARSTSKWWKQTDYMSMLTITNNRGTSATLSFDYVATLSSGTIRVDSETVLQDGPSSFTKELASNGKATVYIESGSTDYDTKITMTNVTLVSADTTAAVTFLPAENGSYTVDGQTIIEPYTKTQSSSIAYQVEATPADGYRFKGWYDVNTGTCINTNDKATLSFDSDCTITARFRSNDLASFETGGQVFDDLNDAVAYAQANRQDKITLASDGKITGTYTIPSGVTLLIPFDAAGTLYTDKPEKVKEEETPTAYKTLTMAPGSSIAVDGAISVGGKHFAGSSGSCCKATGAYGQIIMQEGSRITLNNHANLYAWGYITGDGQITANSGATVYEYFQVADWRGGKATSSMILIPNKQQVFPFSQYYVQNIEAPLTIQNGATEKAYFSVKATGFGMKSVPIDFIGSKKSLFRIYDEGELTKKYDPKTDRITYTTKGSASLDSLALSVAGFNINSENYVLPVNNNMTLNILSGSVAVHCDAALLPGAQITIAQGAELSVSDGKSLYVYDQDQWGPYCSGAKEFVPVPYTPTPKGTRTLANATINVNGTLTAAGSVYTTASGANICSSEGTGRFIQTGGPGTGTTTHQCTQADRDITYVNIPITPAQLHNLDNSYTPTAGTSAGDTFTYCTGSECGGGKWVQNLKVAAINNNDGTQVTTHETLQEAVTEFQKTSNGNTYIKMLHSTTEKIDAKNNLYLDLNGCTVTGDFKMNGKTLYGMDSSANADYDTPPKGKIVGSVSGYARTCQSPTVKVNDVDTYDRYVAILGNEDTTQTLSFHHFNISVTGYRFELAAPKCALFFIGKFQGDEAAKNHLKSLGFTLTDIDNKTTNPRYEIPAGKDIPPMPAKGEASDSEVVYDGEGAFLFEACLMHDIDKENYQTQFSAIAHATFKNSGNSEDNSLSSDERKLSFQEAGKDALDSDPGMNQKDREILTKFLDDLNNSNP